MYEIKKSSSIDRMGEPMRPYWYMWVEEDERVPGYTKYLGFFNGIPAAMIILTYVEA